MTVEWIKVDEHVLIEVDGDERGAYSYRFPDGWMLSNARSFLVGQGLSMVLDYAPKPSTTVQLIWQASETAPGVETYQLPKGWDVHRIREALIESTFVRTDNRQDSPDEPQAFK